MAGPLVFAPIRAQGGWERESMRVFPPLAEDHPAVGGGCLGCDEALKAGDAVTAIPIGPGDSQESREKCGRGGWYTCEAVLAHAECAGVTKEEANA